MSHNIWIPLWLHFITFYLIYFTNTMYRPREVPETSINTCESDSEDSNYEDDEDELTKIIAPEGIRILL